MATEKIFTRDFTLTFFAQFASTSVFHILTPTLPIYLSNTGSTKVEIGILIGILNVSSLVLRPFVGRALLRIPERNFMLGGALLCALSLGAYLVAPPFWPLLIVRIFQGVGMACFFTAAVTLIANISPETHRGQSFSYFYLAFNIALAVGPPLGMFLFNLLSVTALFGVCTVLSLCPLFISAVLGKREVERLPDSPSQESSILSRKAFPPSIVSFFAHVIWGAFAAFFPLYAVSHGVANPGIVFAAYAVTLILGRTLGARILDVYQRERVILPCLVALILAMTVLSFSKTLPMFFLVAVIWGTGNAFLMPALAVTALDRAGSSRGPAMGTLTAVSDLGTGLGPVIMGIILRLTSYQTMFLCLSLTGAINLCYFYFFMRKDGKD